jgi:hypothetical protein
MPHKLPFTPSNLAAVLPQSAYSVEKLEDQMRPNFSQNAFIPKV